MDKFDELIVLLLISLNLFSHSNRCNVFRLCVNTLLTLFVVAVGIRLMFNDEYARGFALLPIIGGGIATIFYIIQIVKLKRNP